MFVCFQEQSLPACVPVVLAPSNAQYVGLYDAGGTRNGAAYTVATLSPATNALLLPYYNKF